GRSAPVPRAVRCGSASADRQPDRSCSFATTSAGRTRRRAGVHVVELPGRLDDSGDLAAQCPVPEADAAHLELVQKGAAAPAELAARIRAHLELRLPLQALRLRHLRELGHEHAVRKGMPKYRSRARPSSSLLAVVTMVMFMPLIFSIRSYLIAAKMSTSSIT